VPSHELTRKASPARLSPVRRVRLRAATIVGDAAALVSRILGKGSGASIRGQVLTRIAPDAFADLVKGRRIVAVSGTNGKTTSTHFVAAALREALGPDAARLVHNADGANLHYGIASALAKARKADVAVIETDERVVADLLKHGRPEVLVLLNFSRDQLDRNHEIKFLGRDWRNALERAGESGPVVIANADDPLVTWAAERARKVIWVSTATTWNADAAMCPACGAMLTRAGASGSWDCPECDLTRHDSDYAVEGASIRLPDGRLVEPRLNVPGSFNVANAAMALAAVAELGVDADTALIGFRTVKAPAGRFSIGTFGDTRARLILSKNPAGWAESLPLLATDPCLLMIDSVAADGKDVSWLWDVDFEQLRGKHVVASGPRAYDLAVRLTYAEVEHEVIVDLDAALASVAGNPDPVDVIATYTPFQKLLKTAGLR
jgi:lipid II isoglutaminyl synthase (glutamine-hydrolysing)